MSELGTRIAEATGLEVGVAERAVGMMLAFLEQEGDQDIARKMINAIPGAAELVSAYGGEGGGFLGGLAGGLMGFGQDLMGLGLGMGEITTLARQTIAIARQYAGDAVVDQVVASVPGLSQFV